MFVEAAEKWTSVKPQAWFDSPAIFLPNTSLADSTRAPHPRSRRSSRQEDDNVDVPSPDPVIGTEPVVIVPPPAPVGSLITEEGISSSFEVTSGMISDSNFEVMEHVTVRVWIDHQRRGDVEVEIKSPSGITSVLARQRRFDDADTGFPGWKFMTLKHWYVHRSASFP